MKNSKTINSRNKGKIGEREFASLLREHGFDARRGQQFSGGADSPDVVSEALAWLHVEVKRVQNLNLTDACVQAAGDSGGKPWMVAHRRNHAPWLITMRAEFFFELIREFQPVAAPQANAASPHTSPLPSPQRGEGSLRTATKFFGATPKRTGESVAGAKPHWQPLANAASPHTSPRPSPQRGEGEEISDAHGARTGANQTEQPKQQEQ